MPALSLHREPCSCQVLLSSTRTSHHHRQVNKQLWTVRLRSSRCSINPRHTHLLHGVASLHIATLAVRHTHCRTTYAPPAPPPPIGSRGKVPERGYPAVLCTKLLAAQPIARLNDRINRSSHQGTQIEVALPRMFAGSRLRQHAFVKHHAVYNCCTHLRRCRSLHTSSAFPVLRLGSPLAC